MNAFSNKSFRSVISKNKDFISAGKIAWYEQILRLIALTHDLGHAPFSHASESFFPDGLRHEDFTTKIIRETCVADYINEIGHQFKSEYGEKYDITPDLICDIYNGRIAGENSEFIFLNSFMDSELDCDKMDYLLRDSLYCGVNYGTFDVDRLISCLTVYIQDKMPRLAIKHGGVQAFEEFVLARYFMFIQVYFHRTRRYFDIILNRALSKILPNGKYPDDVNEYIKWDDNRVMQLIKEKASEDRDCRRIVERIVFSRILETKTHPQSGDKRCFEMQKNQLFNELGKEFFIEDNSADKMPHKIPKKSEIDDGQSIIILSNTNSPPNTITNESHIINNLTEEINIKRLYVCKEKKDEAERVLYEMNRSVD